MGRTILHSLLEGFPKRSDYPKGFSGFLEYLHAILEKKPVVLKRIFMLQPIFTFITSILCLILFRRGFEYIPIVIAFLIFALFTITARLYFIEKKAGIITSLWDTALIFIINNLLLFAIPFYFESMTLRSRNVLFVAILIVATVIAGWYRLYQRIIAAHVFRSAIFYSFTFFSVTNIILPVLFGIRNIWSIIFSIVIALIVMAVFVIPYLSAIGNGRTHAIMFTAIAISLVGIWLGRSLIPPAPLKMTRATACMGIESYRPSSPFTLAKLDPLTEVYFYSSIFAPRGLREKIDHVWRHNGRKLFTVSLSEIHGGRAEGFGTWSRHTIREGKGTYTVEVWTAGGQLLGVGSFTVR